MNYSEFLDRKSQLGGFSGFDPLWMPDFLFDFQKALVDWAIRKGKAAIFADCGLGKTPMQLVWAQNVLEKTNRPVLILTPLAVGPQTVLEGEKFGIPTARSRDGKHSGGIVITNYEKLHLFDSRDFSGVVCDESSILKHFSGATQAAVTRFMLKVPYRLLCTATAAPNDYIELGTSSEALGELGYTDMLTRFFKQTDNKPHRMQEIKEWRIERARQVDGNHFGKLSYRVHQGIGQWRLKGHAVLPFWRWVASWARAIRQPSDLGFDDGRFILPELIEREHVVDPTTPPDGMLFTFPALGLREERDERRRTLNERCELIARLVDHDRPAVVWCHLNIEGDRLEQLIPGSIQVKGSDGEEFKERAAQWFKGQYCICNDPMFRAKLTAWESVRRATGSATTRSTKNSALQPLSNISKSTEQSGSDILPSTTRRTKTVPGDTQCEGDQQRTRNEERGMPVTLTLGKTIKQKSRNGKPPIQESVSISECGSTESPLTDTMTSLRDRAEDAPSAEAAQGINEPLDSTLTIAMQPEQFAASCAQVVTSELGSSATTRTGSNGPRCICGYASGRRVLISKPKIFSFGLNFQHCNHVVTFASHSYEQFYQSVRRCWRFGQQRPVTVDIISTTGEQYVRENMSRKAEACSVMFKELVGCMVNAMHINRKADDTERVEVPAWV